MPRPRLDAVDATPSQHFDDDDVKKSGFDLPYDAEKTRVGGVLPPLYAVAATSNTQGAHA